MFDRYRVNLKTGIHPTISENSHALSSILRSMLLFLHMRNKIRQQTPIKRRVHFNDQPKTNNNKRRVHIKSRSIKDNVNAKRFKPSETIYHMSLK